MVETFFTTVNVENYARGQLVLEVDGAGYTLPSRGFSASCFQLVSGGAYLLLCCPRRCLKPVTDTIG